MEEHIRQAQEIKERFNKQINAAINQFENIKILEFLNDDMIKKLDESINPFYEMAKKLKKLLQKINYVVNIFSEIGKLVQFKKVIDASNKEKPNMTI